MFGEAYIFILATLIPFLRWQQREEGRNLVGMLVTGLFLMLWLLTNTLPVVWDTTTIAVICFSMWMIASMLWTKSRQSSQDLYFMIVCLVIFLVSRRIDLEILLLMLFVPGVVFSAASLYYYKSKILDKRWPIFGNPNHVAAFLLIPMFAGIWLTFNLSLFLAPLVILIVVALVAQSCRGAIAGLVYILCTQFPSVIYVMPFSILGLIILGILKLKENRGNVYHRISQIVAALMLIIKAPIAGYGLRTFRREYPNVMKKIFDNAIMKRFLMNSIDTSIASQTSHRIHNDQLEIIFELGLIGYVLFLLIFSSLMWTASPLLAGAVIAFAVHGLFFFPLREAHTAFPFWALAGGMASTSLPVMTINPLLSIVFIVIVGRLFYEIVIKTLGLSYYDLAYRIPVAANAEDEVGKSALKKRQLFLDMAIRCDPYNNIYLTEGYYYNVFNNPEPAFQYASRCMENYDGGKVKWGVSDQYARALLRLGGFGVAKLALKHSLHLCPDFKQSIELMKQVEEMEKPK
jgi:hypothetical protein